jgi:hypothetical protein
VIDGSTLNAGMSKSPPEEAIGHPIIAIPKTDLVGLPDWRTVINLRLVGSPPFAKPIDKNLNVAL